MVKLIDSRNRAICDFIERHSRAEAFSFAEPVTVETPTRWYAA